MRVCNGEIKFKQIASILKDMKLANLFESNPCKIVGANLQLRSIYQKYRYNQEIIKKSY